MFVSVATGCGGLAPMCCALRQFRSRHLMDLGLNPSEIFPLSHPQQISSLFRASYGAPAWWAQGDSSVRLYPAEGLLL